MKQIFLITKLLFSKKGDLPGWSFIVGLIIVLMAVILLIWLAVKSGRAGIEQIEGFG